MKTIDLSSNPSTIKQEDSAFIPDMAEDNTANKIGAGDLTVIWLGLATFLGSMLFVWQGLDFTDMGFWLTGYQQFYTGPDTLGFQSVCWLTTFIGHWAGYALGGGVLAYKLGYVGVVTLSAIMSYQLLARQLGSNRVLAAMVLLTVFFTRIHGNWIGYYELTALFYIASSLLLFYGLTKNRKLLVMLAGIVLGANTFIRFPNLLGISLISAIWLHAWCCRCSWQNTIARSLDFLCGFIFGLALVWGLIVLHGHQSIYYQGFRELFGIALHANSHHSGSGLLKRFIFDHIRAFTQAITMGVTGVWFANWVIKQKALTALALILISALVLFYINNSHSYSQWNITGLCYIVLLIIVFLEAKKNPHLALVAFIAGIVLVLSPLGTNNGIYNSAYGMWLALPLTLTWLWRISGLSFFFSYKVKSNSFEPSGNFSIKAPGFHVYVIIIVIALLLQSLSGILRHTFRDSNNRFAMTHSIAHPLLRGTYTTEERARVVSELLEALSHFVKPGDELLAHDGIPTLYFLTRTHPWLGIAWADIEGAETIKELIQQKEQTSAEWPCIVRTTGSVYAASWPRDAYKNRNVGPGLTHTPQDVGESRQVLAEFEKRHGYKVAWTNGFFEILTTAK
jgi:hypothetical protein